MLAVTFATSGEDAHLSAVRIDCDAGSCTPSDPDWGLACRLAMSAASTHLSLVRHFGWIHLAGGGTLAVVTRNELPPDHPVRRLVWAHVYATQYSNDLITLDQLTNGGDFESIFGLTHRGVSALIDATVEEFDLGVIDPDVDSARRGLQGLATPSIDNRRQLHGVFLAHARRYLERYYDDDRIAADAAVQSWRAELEPAPARRRCRCRRDRDGREHRTSRGRHHPTGQPSSTRSSARGCGTTSSGTTPFPLVSRSMVARACRSTCTSAS